MERRWGSSAVATSQGTLRITSSPQRLQELGTVLPRTPQKEWTLPPI